jgi:bifunctional non-homologous end joining protein LigD
MPQPRPKARRASIRKPAAPRPAERAERPRFTHVEKVMFPQPGYTKGDVLEFYERISPLLLPHLRDRPMTLERLPDGLKEGAPRFWQKNTPSYYPEWIPRINLPSEQGKPVAYALVNNVETLLYLANQGTITFHPFLSRVQNLDRPDYVLFDFDPGGAKFTDVVKIANTLDDLLDARKIESFPKTSGKSGLHVLVPWRDKGGYAEARAWAVKVAEELVQSLPDLATVERHKAEREGRVYVDVIQNARGHHAVPPYVLRATPQATVSMPLDWKEVNARLDPKRFTLATIARRLKGKADPMRPLVQ